MAQQNRLAKLTCASVLLSFPALALWIGAAIFLLKWIRAWAAGHLEPGTGSNWVGLYGMFAAAVIALAAGIFLTIRAWQGRSTVRWQVLSILLGALLLWATCGD